ncbi:MAG TPA: subclass B3 metallo-beta-lactamase [Rhodanobacteraceae bacterium]|nr:subclass B3 metallo-beta-lactamase [Rhodanobacteraceae bacterium]
MGFDFLRARIARDALAGFALTIGVAAAAAPATNADCEPCRVWNTTVTPFKIFGNAYYVGPKGLSSVLITSDQGHVLIDGDLAESAPLIMANIRALGFRVEDVKYILNSHAHYDHAGGIAAIQRASHATVLAGKAGADAILHGRGDRRDPQFETGRAFEPAANVRAVADGETITLGTIAITAHATPGHTPGGMSWTWQSCVGKKCLDMVYADSLTAISDDDYRFSDEAAHAGVAAAFGRSIAMVGGLPCDILITAHPDASDFWQRKASTTLIDQGACRRYADKAEQAFEHRIADEKAKAAP